MKIEPNPNKVSTSSPSAEDFLVTLVEEALDAWSPENTSEPVASKTPPVIETPMFIPLAFT